MTPRQRELLLAAVTFCLVAAVSTAWLAYLAARSTPHYRQTAPGAEAVPDLDGGPAMRVVSMVATPTLVTTKDAAQAPAGAIYVVATVEYRPVHDDGSCWLNLLGLDGRTWASTSLVDVAGDRPLPSRCSAKPEDGPSRAELIYLIPTHEAGALAGLVSASTAHRTTEPYWVLTPPG